MPTLKLADCHDLADLSMLAANMQTADEREGWAKWGNPDCSSRIQAAFTLRMSPRLIEEGPRGIAGQIRSTSTKVC